MVSLLGAQHVMETQILCFLDLHPMFNPLQESIGHLIVLEKLDLSALWKVRLLTSLEYLLPSLHLLCFMAGETHLGRIWTPRTHGHMNWSSANGQSLQNPCFLWLQPHPVIAKTRSDLLNKSQLAGFAQDTNLGGNQEKYGLMGCTSAALLVLLAPMDTRTLFDFSWS